ncbi:MAG: ABC transporter substrate-binding protein [Cytophagaceae bacterium]|jgi:nitrate/nitrite transport system substrate-binding protein|nr:ABC transporter substrate-binding protein [Cytophagaceae bacterium]
MKKLFNNIQTLRSWRYSVVILCCLSLFFTAATLAPKGEKIRIGFIPLTDCAPIVMAKELGLFAKYGVDVEVTKEASWASVRDKILTGELQGAHCLYTMPLSVYTGVGGKAGSEMYVAMMLSNNGQAITLSKDFCGLVGYKQFAKVNASVNTVKQKKEVTFAMTFPGGTHDLWLRYWMGATGIDQKKVGIITIPPPQMVANMKVDNMEGYCVGEPWGGVAAAQNIGFTHVATQDIWQHHPEKAFVVNKEFATGRKEDMKKVMKAILEACQWLDVPANRKKAAAILAKPYYVNAPLAVIEARLLGSSDLGCELGVQKYKDDYMMFYRGGNTNLPRKSHAIWAMAQYVRFGYLTTPPDYAGIADKLILDDVYREVAKSMNVPIPDDDMKPFTIKLDNVTFDPNKPAESLKLYKPVAFK